MIGNAQGEPPLGDVLADHELVQVGYQGLWSGDRSEESLLGRAFRRRCGLGDWLGCGLGDSLRGAEAADADERVNAAFVQRDVQVQAKIAAER